MSTSALILFHPGFEELETVAPIDLMTRANIRVTTASTSGSRVVRGRSNIEIQAEQLLSAIPEDTYFDALVLPGGPGINAIRHDPAICALLRRHDAKKKWIAAICAAPLLLKDAGLIDETSDYTAFPATKEELPRAQNRSLVRDGRLITSRGAGTATEFALGIVEALEGVEKAEQIAHSICWPH